MREYPSNSHKSKAESKTTEVVNKEKKVQKVVSGKVKTKSNEKRKLLNTFISEDITNIKTYVLMDVLVPTIKKAISDIVTDGVDMLLYGETGGRKRKSSSKVSYRSFYEDKRDREDRNNGGRLRNRFDYDDLVFDTRGEAEAVREQMVEIIDQYGMVTVADMYDMADLPAPYTSSKYGWTNISRAETKRVRDGYILELPKAMPID